MSFPIGNFVPRSLNVIFSGKIGKSEKIGKSFKFSNFCEIYRFEMSRYTSCPNFVKKYWFLRKLHHFSFLPIYKNIDQDFTKIAVGSFQKNSSKFWSKATRVFKFCHYMPYMMYLKVTNYCGSRKIFSMCKIENAASGAKLHPPPPGIGLTNLVTFR